MALNTSNATSSNWRTRLQTLGKEQFIVDEMIRLGFSDITPTQQEHFKKISDELANINTELYKLQKELNGIEDVTPLLKQIRQNRIERVRAKRIVSKMEKEANAALHQETITAREKATPSHLGDDISAGLIYTNTDVEKLKANNLPFIENLTQLAELSKLEEKNWKWLSYHRRVAKIDHYTRFEIPKKKGGSRQIAAPKKMLRKAQTWILENILEKIPAHEAAFAFLPKMNTKLNADHHLNKNIVVRIDLKDFFPSIKFSRVKGLFRSFGYSEAMATIFALVCTDAQRVEAVLDQKSSFVALGARFLPQGACTSPMITNLICRKLDNRLQNLSKKLGEKSEQKHNFSYTRYADDLVFSTESKDPAIMKQLLHFVNKIVADEQLEINREKTMIMRKSQRQTVTGVLVNGDNTKISRTDIRKFRAFLHQFKAIGEVEMSKKMGKDAKHYGKGYFSYLKMISPAQAAKMAETNAWLLEK